MPNFGVNTASAAKLPPPVRDIDGQRRAYQRSKARAASSRRAEEEQEAKLLEQAEEVVQKNKMKVNLAMVRAADRLAAAEAAKKEAA